MTITEALKQYLSFRYDLGDTTRRIYTGHVLRLANYYHDPQLAHVTPEALAKFFCNLKPERNGKSEYSPFTIHQTWRSLHTFFAHCQLRRWITDNPMLPVPKPSLNTGPKDRLTLLEIDKILHAIDRATGPKHLDARARNRAVVLLMVDSGLRPNEVATLKTSDVDLITREAIVHDDKTHSTRTVPISKPTRQAIINYLDIRPEPDNGVGPLPWLFLKANAYQQITQKTITKMVKRLKKRSGIERLYPYLFRHTFAMHYIRVGELQKLSKIMGHKSPSTTARYYADPELDAVKADFELASPMAQLEKAGGGKDS